MPVPVCESWSRYTRIIVNVMSPIIVRKNGHGLPTDGKMKSPMEGGEMPPMPLGPSV